MHTKAAVMLHLMKSVKADYWGDKRGLTHDIIRGRVIVFRVISDTEQQADTQQGSGVISAF